VERSREFDDIGNEYRSFTRLQLEKRLLIDALGMGMDQGRGARHSQSRNRVARSRIRRGTGKLPAQV